MTNTTSFITRTVVFTSNYSLKTPPVSLMVGMSDFEIASNKFIDFAIYNSTPSLNGVNNVNFTLYPGSAMGVITFQLIAAASGTSFQS